MSQEQAQPDPGFGPELTPGSKIGKYEVVRKLASGPHAEVYEAYDELLDRHVAIKHVSPELVGESGFLQRFRRETRILARLGAEQKSIISVYELLEHSDGLFIIMEFAPGESLETILKRSDGPIDAREGLQILWRLAAGLHAVHSAGIVHRDIKPSNFIISEDLRVKITDFGLTVERTEPPSPSASTARYMSPEASRGEDCDERSDIYSLGFVCYEMFLGRAKFEGMFADVANDPAGAAEGWMAWHGRTEDLVPPLTDVNEDIPKALSDIVAKMIAKDPSERFESMEQLGRTIKLNFSPRPEAPVVAGGGFAPRPRPEPPALGEHDEADELEISATGVGDLRPEPTDNSTRMKVALSVMSIVAVLAVGVSGGLYINRSRTDRADMATTMYDKGLEDYDRGDHLSAAEKFAELRSRFPRTQVAIKASVMEHLARGYAGIGRKDWTAAESAQSAASARAHRVRDEHRRLEKWAQSVIQDIQKLAADRARAKAFFEALDSARAAGESGEYGSGREIISARIVPEELTSQQRKLLESLLTDLETGQFTKEVESLFARADEMIAQGEFSKAEENYGQLDLKLFSPEARVLGESARGDLATRLKAARSAMASERAFRSALVEADQSRDAGNRTAELDALKSALEIRPGDSETTERIKGVRVAIALTEGRDLAAIGELPRAKAQFEQALELDSANEEARGELERTEKEIMRSVLISSGNADSEQGKIAEALTKYEQAAGIRRDSALERRIVDSRFRLARTAADALREGGQFAEALLAYEALKEIDSARSSEIETWKDETRLAEQYAEYIQKGDQALVDGRWVTAVRSYRSAKEIKPTPEVDKRIANARYVENLTRGKDAMNRGELTSAKGYFNIAKKYRLTEELEALIKEVTDRLGEGRG